MKLVRNAVLGENFTQLENQMSATNMLQTGPIVKLCSDQSLCKKCCFTYMWVTLKKMQWTWGTWYRSRGDQSCQRHVQHRFQPDNRLVQPKHQQQCGLLAGLLTGTETKNILHLNISPLKPKLIYSNTKWWLVIICC